MTDDQQAARADMRIEIVKREINQGVLAGFGSTCSDYAAKLVLAALDTFDQDVEQRAYTQGFQAALGQVERAKDHP